MCVYFSVIVLTSVIVMTKFRVTIGIWASGLRVGWGVLRSAVRYELSFSVTCSTLASMGYGLLYGQAAG